MKEEKTNYWRYLAGLLGILLVALFVWRMVAVRGLEKQIVDQRVELTKQYGKIVADRTVEMLRLTAVPFVWAIRKEMLRDNFDQINEYLVHFVKEPMVKQVLVVKSDGTVAVATDKKMEGASFAALFPAQQGDGDETKIVQNSDGTVTVVAPVMGLNSRLGFIYMVCSPEPMPTN